MSRRRLQALRNLAERPGTEAEGILAAVMLARYEAKHPHASRDTREADGRYVPSEDFLYDEAYIRSQVRDMFPRGTRVYYNKWAYSANFPGVVTGYPRKAFKGSWAWIRIKFDDLRSARAVPIYTHESGWHLSKEPMPESECDRLHRVAV